MGGTRSWRRSALIAAGYVVSRPLSRALVRLLSRRARMDEGASTATRTLGFCLLFVVLVFTPLTRSDFPMTIFTIAGGAVAIGAGFGRQQVLQDWISGIILHPRAPDPDRRPGRGRGRFPGSAPARAAALFAFRARRVHSDRVFG